MVYRSICDQQNSLGKRGYNTYVLYSPRIYGVSGELSKLLFFFFVGGLYICIGFSSVDMFCL